MLDSGVTDLTYYQKLRDPRWQKRRLEIFNRDNFKCVICKDGTTELHVHHGAYISGKDPWDYDDNMLFTLCEEHHDEVESLRHDIGLMMCYSHDALDIFQFAAKLVAANNADNLVAVQFLMSRISENADALWDLFRASKSIPGFERGEGHM